MSAVLKTQEAQFEPMSPARLDDVLAVEQVAYAHPWSRGNFQDSLAQGYQMQMLTVPAVEGGSAALMGYFVAMQGVDEVHLLNITVAPAWQGQGWARVMLDALAIWARGRQAQWLWLEVRRSNQRAQQIYLRNGFKRVGERKGYYPDGPGRREDAVVMSLKL